MQGFDYFRGKYEFLSNFHRGEFEYIGRQYISAEHALQAAKCMNDIEKEKIRTVWNSNEAQHLGRRVQLGADRKLQKEAIMEDILRMKFRDIGLRAL